MRTIFFAFGWVLMLPCTLEAYLAPPRNVLAAPGNARIEVRWQPVPGAESYIIKRSLSAASVLESVATNLSDLQFTDTNVNNGRNYFYVVTGVAAGREGAESPRVRAVPSAPILDLLPAGAKLEKLGGSFGFTEGPVWIQTEGGYLVFSDINNNRLIRWTPGKGTSIFRTPSNRANGNTLDSQGRLLSCQQVTRSVTRTESDGTILTLVSEHKGKQFNEPNDVVVKSDGTVWFTDPTYGNTQAQPGRYVYRFDPADGNSTVTAVATNLNQPNGLCFSPDEKLLYVADNGRGQLRVFDVMPDNSLANQRLFAASAGADGIRADRLGRVYSTASDGVQIFGTDGKLLTRIVVPEIPANVAFGGTNQESLFITARTGLYGISRLPDLIVTSILRSPVNPVAGQRVAFTAIVKNQGTAPTPAGSILRVAFSIGTATNLLWADSFAESLPPDASIALECTGGVSGSTWVSTAGSFPVRAVVDDRDRFGESNETNNAATLNVAVTAAPPDSDGDGTDDVSELAAGTDPGDPASVFRIVSIERVSDGEMKLTWSSVAGKKYRILCLPGLDGFSWSQVSIDIDAPAPLTTWTSDIASGSPVTLFRVQVAP